MQIKNKRIHIKNAMEHRNTKFRAPFFYKENNAE